MVEVQDKQAEFEHNKSVFNRAELFWGWATPAGEKRGQRRADQFIEFLGPCRGKRFLEFGCGKGWFTQKLKDCGAQVAAFDIQTEFVQVARMRMPQRHLRFVVADSEFLPFADGSFDGAYGAAVLHHLPMASSMKELFRVLKPGGRISFAEPNMLNPQLLVMKNIWWIGKRMGESPNETAFFKWQMRGMLRRAGFADINVEPFDFLHPLTPPAMIPRVEKLGRLLEKTPLIREIAGSLDIRAMKRIL